MALLGLIVVFTSLGGLLSVIAASAFLLMPERLRQSLLPHGISFAIGALLAVAFWGLLPEAFAGVRPEQFQALSGTVLAGILLFFVLEKMLIWRHCHHGECEVHADETSHDHAHPTGHQHGIGQSVGAIIILGDAIHNFVDGVLIAAAFLTDVQLGIATSLAVAAHEIPQEVGDFAILLQSGYSIRKAFVYNMLASLATLLGGLAAYFGLDGVQGRLPYILALAASSFIYIAVADLIPSLHKKTDLKASLEQIALIGMGVLLIGSLHHLTQNLG